MQAPGSTTGDLIDLNKLKGSLLYITVHEVVKEMMTKYGASDAVRADVAVLDGDEKGTVLHDALFFPKVLFRQLSGAAGSVDPNIIGRLGQGEAKSGQDAPWVLSEPTEADLAIGVKYERYAAQQKEAQEAPF